MFHDHRARGSTIAARAAATVTLVGILLADNPAAVRSADPAEMWTTFANTNTHAQLVADPIDGSIWAATEGGAIRWDPAAGSYTQFGVRDGLGSTGVSGIDVDPRNGDVWFATYYGASRRTRAGEWTTFDPRVDGSADLRSVDVNPVSGDIWFGVRGGWVDIRSADGQWDLGATRANDIAIDPRNGDTWLASEVGVTVRRVGGNETLFSSADGLGKDDVRNIVLNPWTGEVWAWCSDEGIVPGGLWRRRPGSDRFEEVRNTGQRVLDAAKRIAFDPVRQDMWVTDGVNLARMARDGTWRAYPVLAEPDWVFDLTVDPATGNPWMNTCGDDSCVGTLIQWLVLDAASGAITSHRTDAPLQHNDVTDVEVDARTQTTWVATLGGGVGAYHSDGRWAWLTAGSSGLVSDWVLDIAVDASTGDVWMTHGSSGVGHLDSHGALIAVDLPPELKGEVARAIEVNPVTGDVWFSVGESLVRRSRNGDMTTFTAADGFPKGIGSIAANDVTGAMWFGSWSAGALELAPDGSKRAFRKLDGLSSDEVHAIDVNALTGEVWFATNDGASRRDAAGRWARFRDDLSHPNVNDVAVDRTTGEVWFATDYGLSRRVRDDRWITYDVPDGLVDDYVITVAVDPATGSRWFGTRAGLTRLQADSNRSTCDQPIQVSPGSSTAGQFTSRDERVFAFDIAEPFSRVEVSVPDVAGRFDLEVFRTCGGSIGTGSGRHIGTGSGRHIGGEARVAFDVTNQTGTYYAALAPTADAPLPLDYQLRVAVTQVDPRATHTLILTHAPRIASLFGLAPDSAEMERWRDAIERLAAEPSVGGRIVWDVQNETDAAVSAAYGRWITAQRDPARAAAVADALRAWIWSSRRTFDRVQYIVLAGDDRVLPLGRLSIQPGSEGGGVWVGEDRYVADGQVDPLSAVGSALQAGLTLSDDVYAAPLPAPWSPSSEIFVPEIAVGRLVERPSDMTAVVESFLAGAGTRPLDRSLIGTYGFMDDAGDAVDGALGQAGLPAADRVRLTGAAMTADALAGALFGLPPDLALIGAHSDHAKHVASDGSVLTAAQVRAAGADLAGMLVLTLACHGGVNVQDVDEPHPLDLAQAWAGHGASLIASTGWAYGEETFLGYQEALMAEFAAMLVDGGGSAIGDALVAAKRSYALHHPPTALHAKTVAGTVLYGLPMQQLQLSRQAAARLAALRTTRAKPSAARASGVQQAGPERLVQHVRFDLPTGGLQPVPDATSGGAYYTFSGSRPRAESGEVVQPQLVQAIAEASLDGDIYAPRGIVLTGATFRDVPGFRPVIAAAQLFGRNATGTRQATVPSGWSPAIPAVLRSAARTAGSGRFVDGGVDTNVLVTAGQYHGGTAIERLYEEVAVDVYFARSADTTSPTITALARTADGADEVVSVSATDAGGVDRVVLAYASGRDGRLSSLEMTRSGDRWHGRVPRSDAVFVQVVDGSGNVRVVTGTAEESQPSRPGEIFLPIAAKAHSLTYDRIGFVARHDDGSADLCTARVDGSDRTCTAFSAGVPEQPDWSPDGSRVLLVMSRPSTDRIQIMDADGSGLVELPIPAPIEVSVSPKWAPGGRHLVFNGAYNDTEYHYAIFMVNTDGRGLTRLTSRPRWDIHPDWSPDGNRIAFASNRDANFEIYVMHEDGTAQRRLTFDDASDTSPDWSPDGSRIALTRMYGRDDVGLIVMRADGTHPIQVAHGASIGSPDWSSDGSRLIFQSSVAGGARWIYLMEEESGVWSVPRPLFEGWDARWLR